MQQRDEYGNEEGLQEELENQEYEEELAELGRSELRKMEEQSMAPTEITIPDTKEPD
jgi:hypothetical protein